MDLRSFAEANSGCRFELAKIAQSGRLGTTVFVVDQSSPTWHCCALASVRRTIVR